MPPRCNQRLVTIRTAPYYGAIGTCSRCNRHPFTVASVTPCGRDTCGKGCVMFCYPPRGDDVPHRLDNRKCGAANETMWYIISTRRSHTASSDNNTHDTVKDTLDIPLGIHYYTFRKHYEAQTIHTPVPFLPDSSGGLGVRQSLCRYGRFRCRRADAVRHAENGRARQAL